LYARRNVMGGNEEFTHAVITIYERENLQNDIRKAVDEGKLLYINNEQVTEGNDVTDTYAGIQQPTLDYNLSQFNEKLKTFKLNDPPNSEGQNSNKQAA